MSRDERLQNRVTKDGGRNIGEGIAKKNGREQSMRLVEKFADNLALGWMFLSQAAELQFAEREQGNLGSREERRQDQESSQREQFENQRNREHERRRKSMKLPQSASIARRNRWFRAKRPSSLRRGLPGSGFRSEEHTSELQSP